MARKGPCGWRRPRRLQATGLRPDVAVAVQHHAVPAAEVRRRRRQPAQQRPLQSEQPQRLLAHGAMHARAGLAHHPCSCLRVEVGQVAERARGQEVALDVLDAGFDDALTPTP